MKKQVRGRRNQIASFVASTLASAAAGPGMVWAQSADATLSGYTTPGATVTVHNPATGLTRHGVAAGDGHYVIAGLPPGDYTADAGPGTEQSVTLQVATTTELDLGAKLAEVVVSGHAVHQETMTSEVGQVVSLHDIDVLPQYTRNFLEFASRVPGVQFNVDGSGNTNVRGGAQLYSNVNVYIDGVSQKDYVNGGIAGQSGPGQSGDPGNPFPQLAIEEYKVVTSNYKAEFGEAASAVILAQTRSGTNHFEGDAFSTFTNQSLRAETPAELAANKGKSSAPSWEYGVAEGGPIIQDKMHFFLTYERKTLSLQNVVLPGGGVDPAVVTPLLPANVASQYGPTTQPFTEDLGFGKVDFEPTESDRMELTGKIRTERQLQGAANQTAASAAQHYKNDDTRWMLRWVHDWQGITNQALVTHQNTTSNTNASPSPQFQYLYYPTANNTSVSQPLINVGGPGAGVGFRYEQSGFGLQDDLTFSNLHDHTLKVGARFQAIDLLAAAGTVDLRDAVYYEAVSNGNWPNTPSGVYANPYEVQFPVSFPGVGAPSVDSKDKQFGVYIQDDWAVNRNLALNLGVRWDYEKVPGFQDYVTPASLVTALNSPGANPGYPANVTYAQLLATAVPSQAVPAININNYISTGSNRSPPTNQWQPRLGFSYDVKADQQYVFFGGYGRSYDRNVFSQLAYETTKVGLYNNPQIYFPTPFTNDSFGPCHVAGDVNPTNHCYSWNPSYLTAAGLATLPVSTSSHEADMINNGIRSPHSDQFSIGFRTRLADWDAQIALSDIKSYDAIIGHLGLRYADGSYYDNQAAPWGAFGSLKGYGALILWDNAGHDTNQQMTISINKSYTKASGWGFSAAYTFSNAYQNNVAGPADPYAGNPNAYLFDLPSPYDYALLPSTAVPKHRLVLTGSHDLPWGVLLGAKFEIATPRYVDAIFGCLNGSPCNGIQGNAFPINVQIPGTIGYRDLDMTLSKQFSIWQDVQATARFDVLNVFDFHNFDPNNVVFPSTVYGQPVQPVHYNSQGPIVSFPRTLRLTAELKW